MSERKEFRDLVDPDVARETIGSLPIDPGTEQVELTEARGRVIAERVDATIDVPGFDRATVDGYAVQSGDVVGADEGSPVMLEQVGTLHAGERAAEAIDSGETVEISTGAVLPPGADAVVMVERTRERSEGIAVETAVAPGDNVMSAGADVAAGHRAIGPGRALTARDVAMLAALGRESVSVRRRPRVGVISTGDELVRPGETLDHARGQVYDVNSHTLVAAIEAAGGEAVLYPHVADDRDAMRRMLERAADECDLVCSSGSTSASAVDVIYRVIENGGEVLHHGVAVKPGKPMLIGTIGEESAYVGLPGFPVSALMTFRSFVAPWISEAAGIGREAAATTTATMAAEARFGEGRLRLLPVGLVEDGEGSMRAYPVDKGSGATTSLVHADGVVEVPADTAFVGEEEAVTVKRFEADGRPPSILAVGEDDPVFVDLLDHVEDPRFLPVGTVEGHRRFERNIPDVAVLAGSTAADPAGEVLGRWRRRWGIVLAEEYAADVETLEDLVDADVRFANLGATALREALDGRLATLADERGVTVPELAASIPGYGMGRPGHESAARRVKTGEAGAGLALERTASAVDVPFLPVGEQRVVLVASADRAEKEGVAQLADAVDRMLSTLIDRSVGYLGDEG